MDDSFWTFCEMREASPKAVMAYILYTMVVAACVGQKIAHEKEEKKNCVSPVPVAFLASQPTLHIIAAQAHTEPRHLPCMAWTGERTAVEAGSGQSTGSGRMMQAGQWNGNSGGG